MKSIELKNICKSYGNNEVVKNLDLNIKKGERLILLGPSGCGKSTTLRMIAGLEEITSGDLIMDGKKMNRVQSGKRNVSMVFQNYALFPHMTVEENITYGLKVHKLPKEEIAKRLKEVIQMLELTGLEKRKPKDLSGGQRQRVALARAIVKQSDFLLLDEPLSNLDAQLRQHARKELVKIHEKYHQTIVYVTHDQIEAMTVGDRIALLYEGKLKMLDTPQNVYNKPANVFTAKFIGSPCCNVVEAKQDAGRVYFGRQSVTIPEYWNRYLCSQTAGKSIYFGIRPEHIKLSQTPHHDSFTGVVKYVEDYGNRVGIYFEIEGYEWIMVNETSDLKPGDSIYFAPDFKQVHLFDYSSEKTLGYPEEIEGRELDAVVY